MGSEAEIAEIWRLFRETRENLERMARLQEKRHAEWERYAEESRRQFAELRQRSAETDRQIAETNRQLARTDAQLARTDAQLDRTDRQILETQRIAAEANRRVEDIASKWGRFLEKLVEPAAQKIFEPWGIPVHDAMRERIRRRGGETMELDVIVANHDAVVVVEVKSTLKANHVAAFSTKLGRFKEFVQEYKGYRLYGAVAGIVIDEHADRYAMKEGLFVLVQSGDMIMIRNDPAFEPRVW